MRGTKFRKYAPQKAGLSTLEGRLVARCKPANLSKCNDSRSGQNSTMPSSIPFVQEEGDEWVRGPLKPPNPDGQSINFQCLLPFRVLCLNADGKALNAEEARTVILVEAAALFHGGDGFVVERVG